MSSLVPDWCDTLSFWRLACEHAQHTIKMETYSAHLFIRAGETMDKNNFFVL